MRERTLRPDASPETVRAAVVETLAGEADVVAAYLFGSTARGTAGPLSDTDVGVLVSSRDQHILDRTMDALCRRLHTSRIDVVSLTGAPMPVRFRVVREGSLVLCRDPAALQRFIAETVRHYLDFSPLRDRAFAVMRADILEGR